VPAAPELLAACERITLGAHGLRELDLLDALRAPDVELEPGVLAAAERLLGAHGPDPADRLGLPADARPADVLRAAREARTQWQDRADDPLLGRQTRHACRVLVRTCEELLVAVGAAEPAPA
jgi:hypothetical protein